MKTTLCGLLLLLNIQQVQCSVTVLNSTNIRSAVNLWINNQSVALSQYGSIETWDTSNVTSLNLVFWSTSDFAADISGWDVRQVTSMQSTFSKTKNFGADVSGWATTALQSLEFAFANSEGFKSDVSGWDTSQVTTLSGVLSGSTNFAGSGVGGELLNNWDTSNVTDFASAFENSAWFTTALCWDLTSAVAERMKLFSCGSPGGIDCGCFPMEGEYCNMVDLDCSPQKPACITAQNGATCPVEESGSGGGSGSSGNGGSSSGSSGSGGGSNGGGPNGGGAGGEGDLGSSGGVLANCNIAFLFGALVVKFLMW